MLVSIYVLVDPRDDRVFYVGKTESKLAVRLRCHICDALAGRSSAEADIRAIIEAGLRPIIRQVEAASDDWAAAEKRWIAYYRQLGPIANRTSGGQGVSGVIRTDEWKVKVVQSRRDSGRGADGIKRAAEKNRGRVQSPEERALRSEVLKGRRPSETVIEIVGARYRGKKLTPEHAAQAGNAWRGKKQTAEHGNKKRLSMQPHQAKQSSDQAARWCDPEYRTRVVASMKASHARRKENRN